MLLRQRQQQQHECKQKIDRCESGCMNFERVEKLEQSIATKNFTFFFMFGEFMEFELIQRFRNSTYSHWVKYAMNELYSIFYSTN